MGKPYDYDSNDNSEAAFNAGIEYAKLSIEAIRNNFDALGMRDYKWMYDNFLQKLNLVWALLNETEREEMLKLEKELEKFFNDYEQDNDHIKHMQNEFDMTVPPNGARRILFMKLIVVDRRIQELMKDHELTTREAEADIGL